MLTLLSIKTLFRTPLKTLLTFLLLAATSYTLFFSAAEYAAMSQERARAMEYYQGTAAIEAEAARQYMPDGFYNEAFFDEAEHTRVPNIPGTDFYLYTDERVENDPYGEWVMQNAYKGLSWEVIEAVARLPYVTRISERYMTAGISEDLLRSDYRDDYFNYAARYVIEATFFGIDPEPKPLEKGEHRMRTLSFHDLTLLAGDPRLFAPFRGGGILSALFALESYPYPNGSVVTSGINSNTKSYRLETVMHLGESSYNEIYSNDFLSGLIPGERYIIVGRIGPESFKLYLSDPATVNTYQQVYRLSELPENYLDLPEFAPLRELIELTNADVRTFDVVYTDDMSSIMRFAEANMLITHGRMLTPEDSENKNSVCVMNDRYMAENGLKIGDRLKLKLGDKLFEQNPVIGAVASVRERYPESFTEAEFEIVGAYRDVDTAAQQTGNLYWTYSANTVFVPLPFLPVEVPDDHVIKPGEFSFVIDDPRNISAFLAEARPIIEDELGLTLMFTDGGWSELEGQINKSVTLAAVRLALLCFCITVAIILTVYLFIGRKRKEYAIMRALGTPFKRANSSLYVPLVVLGVFALAAGNVFGYARVGSRIEEVLAPFAQPGIETEAAVPGYLIVICFVYVFAALALVTAYMLHRIGKKPPLALLQTGTNWNAAKESAPSARDHTAQAVSAGPATMPARDVSEIKTPVQTSKKNSATRHVVAYIAQHIRRTPAKSLFSLGLALLLVGTIGQLTVIRGVYRGLYENLDIKAYILDDGITVENAIEVADSQFVKAFYGENISFSLACHKENLRVIMSNDIMRVSAGAARTEFLDGYDYSSLSTVARATGPANICVMESVLMQTLGVKLGDKVRIHNLRVQYMLIVESFGTRTPADPQWDKMEAAVDPMLDKKSVFYTVVGRASGVPENSVFVPVTRGFDQVLLEGDKFMDYVECTLVSPQYAEEFSRFAKSKIIAAVGNMSSPFAIDTSEADNLHQTINLLNTLYPIAIAAAVIMSGLFPGLIVMQTDREASIMRVLGTTKRRTRVILVVEQAALCLLGLLCAAAVLLLINGVSIAEYIAPLGFAALALLAGCIAGAVICAVIVTQRRILELLQVKE